VRKVMSSDEDARTDTKEKGSRPELIKYLLCRMLPNTEWRL
jgi:hypothetical protein